METMEIMRNTSTAWRTVGSHTAGEVVNDWSPIKKTRRRRGAMPNQVTVAIKLLKSGKFRTDMVVGQRIAAMMGMPSPARAVVMKSSSHPFLIMLQRPTDESQFSIAFSRSTTSPNSRIRFVEERTTFSKQMKSSPVEIVECHDGTLVVDIHRAVTQNGF